MDSIAHLPLVVVFRFLEPADRGVAARVCRRWAAVATSREVWHDADYAARQYFLRRALGGGPAKVQRATAACGATWRDFAGQPMDLLTSACRLKSLETVEWLIDQIRPATSSWRALTEDLWGPIRAAAKAGSVDIVRLLAEHYRLVLHETNFNGKSVFRIACKAHNRELIELCIARGASRDEAIDYSNIDHIGEITDVEYVIYLAKKLSLNDIDISNDLFKPILLRGDLAGAQRMLHEFGLDIFRCISLSWVAYSGSADIVRWYRRLRPDDLSTPESGLASIASEGNVAFAEWWIDHFRISPTRVVVGLRSPVGCRTPLAENCKAGRLGAMQWIVSRGHLTEDADDFHADGQHILYLAVKNGHVDIADWLIDRFGAGQLLADSSVVYLSVVYGHLEMLQYLDRLRPDVVDNNSARMFATALRNGFEDMARWIFARTGVPYDVLVVLASKVAAPRSHVSREFLSWLDDHSGPVADPSGAAAILWHACDVNDAPLAEYLMGRFAVAPDSRTAARFQLWCARGELHMAQQFWRCFGAHIASESVRHSLAVVEALGRYDVAEWLQQLL